jgi:hypothetical protein
VAHVSDPIADPARYAAEFVDHGLDVDLSPVPASPTVVGTVICVESDRAVEVIDAPGECESAHHVYPMPPARMCSSSGR